MASDAAPIVEHLFRQQAGRLTARLTRVLGPSYITLAEDAVQEAMIRALRTWPFDGVPVNAAGWLYTVAHRIAIDAVRRDRSFGDKTDAIVAEITASGTVSATGETDVDDRLRDDELRMIFMCCHPEIARDASVALSLKTVGGFSIREIARAFLADEAAIAQRIVRAKRQIRERRLTLDLPTGRVLGERLDAVLDVLYFMFNEGYAAHQGEELIRRDLCMEAIRLGRLIALGFRHFDRSMNGDEVSAFHAQAAIAATQARALTPEMLDWALILEFYDQLAAIDPSPVVALNRAVAVAKARGAADGLAAVAGLGRDPKLRHYHLLMAVRGQLLAELGRTAEAARSYEAALECEGVSEPERRFLRRRCEAVTTRGE